MNPERLKGEAFVNGDKLRGLIYRNGKLSLNDIERFRNSPIHSLFSNIGEGWLSNNEEFGDCFQLGWNSVAKFKVTGSAYVLTDIKVLKDRYGMSAAQLSANLLAQYGQHTYSQVVTRAVNTCTFAYLKSGNTIVLAHLDYNDHIGGLAAIREFLPPQANMCVTGLCSRTWDERRNDRQHFYDGLTATYGNNIISCIRHKNNKDNVVPYYGHFEIGVYFKNNYESELFGDFTFEPYSVNASTSVNFFETVREFNAFAQKNTYKSRS